MNGLLKRLEALLAAGKLLPRGARVVLAVSGGVDSMALLHALHRLSPVFGWKLSVAHFNHRLRGRSSAADERLVRNTAKRLRLPYDVAAADVRTAAIQRKISVEMAARELRHAFLAKCARDRKARLVGLAHHADDQVELFLLRLMRGAGGDGLSGMAAKSVSSADRGLWLVRPLLDFHKEELRAFVREQKISFREDASNAATEFERNWVRLELLPLLRRRLPAVADNILRTMRIIGAEADFVDEVAEAWSQRSIRRSRGMLEHVPVAIQRRVLRSQLRALGVEPDFRLVEELRQHPGKRIGAGSGGDFVCEPNGNVRRVEGGTAEFLTAHKRVLLREERSNKFRVLSFGEVQLEWRLTRRQGKSLPSRIAGREFFDADKVGSKLLLRHWRAGDRFQPIGFRNPTKLQDWFTNRKVSAERRRRLILAESERGEVFWVEGERIGELCKVTPDTTRLLELRWNPL